MIGYIVLVTIVSCASQSAVALKCLYDFTATDVTYNNQGVFVSATSDHFNNGVRTCQTGLDNCANFDMTNITDFLKLDASTKDSQFASFFNSYNGMIRGKACISNSDAVFLKTIIHENCTQTSPCYCTTDKCLSCLLHGQ